MVNSTNKGVRIGITNGHSVSTSEVPNGHSVELGLLIAATGGSGVGVDLLTTSVPLTTDKLQAQQHN